MSGLNPIQYFSQVNQELQKVTWPTREQTTHMTLIVLFVSAVTGIYLGGLDFALTRFMTYLLP